VVSLPVFGIYWHKIIGFLSSKAAHIHLIISFHCVIHAKMGSKGAITLKRIEMPISGLLNSMENERQHKSRSV